MSIPGQTLAFEHGPAFNTSFRAKLKNLEGTTIAEITKFRANGSTDRYPRFGMPEKDVQLLIGLANNILNFFEELQNAFQTYFVVMKDETFASQNLTMMLITLENMIDNFEITHGQFRINTEFAIFMKTTEKSMNGVSEQLQLIRQALKTDRETLSAIPGIMRDIYFTSQ